MLRSGRRDDIFEECLYVVSCILLSLIGWLYGDDSVFKFVDGFDVVRYGRKGCCWVV